MPIGRDDGDIASARLVLDGRAACGRKAMPEVRATQIFGPIASGAADVDDLPASLSERLPDGVKIKRGVNGVACACMIEHELEASRVSCPDPARPSRRETSQAHQGAGDNYSSCR